MDSILRRYRPFLLFLGKFLGTYLLLTIGYQLYLSQFDQQRFETDGVTAFVARNVGALLDVLGQEASIAPRPGEASFNVDVGGHTVVRIVEGCNAISLMILFAAFVVAFSSTLKRTLLYILAGLVIIHVLNVVRIALLTLGIHRYPEYTSFLHDIVFPLVIYGVVFALWVIWIRYFSVHAKKK